MTTNIDTSTNINLDTNINLGTKRHADGQTVLPMSLPDSPASYIVLPLSDLPQNKDLSGPDPEPGLVASVRDLGILEPILVIQQQNGTFKLEAGARRVKAARAAGLTTISARVLCEDSIDEGMAALAENDHRSNNRFRELEAILKLESKYRADGVADEDLAEMVCTMTHKKLQQYKKAKRLEYLLPEIYESGRSGGTRQSICDMIAHRTRDEQANLLVVLREKGRIKHEDVQGLKRVSTMSLLTLSIPTSAFLTPDAPVVPVVAELTVEESAVSESSASLPDGESLASLMARLVERVQEEMENPLKRTVFGMTRLDACVSILESATLILPDHNGRGQRAAIRQIIKSLQDKSTESLVRSAQPRK